MADGDNFSLNRNYVWPINLIQFGQSDIVTVVLSERMNEQTPQVPRHMKRLHTRVHSVAPSTMPLGALSLSQHEMNGSVWTVVSMACVGLCECMLLIKVFSSRKWFVVVVVVGVGRCRRGFDLLMISLLTKNEILCAP